MRESLGARAQMRVAGALGVAMAAVIVAQAALLGDLIARAVQHRVSLSSLTVSLVALVVVLTARALLSGAFELTGRLAATRVMTDLRGRLVEQLLLRTPMARENARTGELAAAAVQGVDALEAYFAGYLPQLVLGAVVPLAIVVWIAPMDPVAAGLLAVTVPLLILFMILVGKGAQSHARARWRALSLLSGHFLDVVRGLQTLRAYRREAAQVRTIEEVGDRYRAETMATLRVAFLSALVLELCAMLGTAIVAVTIGVQLDAGTLSLAAGLTVLLLAPELYGPLRAVGQQFHASTDGMAAAERIYEVLDAPAPVAVAHLGSRPDLPDPRRDPLRFHGVSFAYPDRDADVLDGLSFEIVPGATTALVGASGAGKSTVAALALRLADPTAGEVECGGVDLRLVAPADWQRQLAWVPQRARLFSATIAENIALGEPGASRGRIAAAAAAAGLADLLEQLAGGLDTLVGDGGRRLSSGQAQRIGVARAFLLERALIVLDEPTAFLDAQTAMELGGAITRLIAGRTALLITHDRALLAVADHVVTLVDGCARLDARVRVPA